MNDSQGYYVSEVPPNNGNQLFINWYNAFKGVFV